MELNALRPGNVINIKSIVRLANANSNKLGGDLVEIRKGIDGSDIAIAGWQDYGQPLDIGTLVIKGANLLRRAVADRTEVSGAVFAIRCVDGNHAEALRIVCGERNVTQ